MMERSFVAAQRLMLPRMKLEVKRSLLNADGRSAYLSTLTPTRKHPTCWRPIAPVLTIRTQSPCIIRQTYASSKDKSAALEKTAQDWNKAERTISSLLRKKTRSKVERAWGVLNCLVDEEKRNPKSDPSRMTEMTGWLNRIVDAWRVLYLKNRDVDCLAEANNMLASFDHYKPCHLPDVRTYNMIVNAVTAQGMDGPGVARFAEQVLDRMYQEAPLNPRVLPDVITYNRFLTAWAKSGLPEGAEKAEALFMRMQRAGLKPDAISFNSVITAFANSGGWSVGRKSETILVKPDTSTFNAVITAWANSHHKDAGKQAETILSEMQDLYKAGNPCVRPDTVSFNSVITAWANSRDPYAGKQAEAILYRMQELCAEGDPHVKPNSATFNSVIVAWTKSGDPSAGERAEVILEQMQKMMGAGNQAVALNAMTYNSVISAWGNSKSPMGAERASAHLDHMMKLAAAGNTEFKPDKFTYNAAIDTWKKSGHPYTSRRVQELYKEMSRLKVPQLETRFKGQKVSRARARRLARRHARRLEL